MRASLTFLDVAAFPEILIESACSTAFSRPAPRLLTLWPASSPNRLSDPIHRRLQPFRYLYDCSDCQRLERQLPGGIDRPLEDRAFARRTESIT